MIVLPVLDCDRSRIVDFGNGSSSTFETTAKRALPVNDSTRSVMSLEHVVVDQKSFVAHSCVEVHRLAADTS